MTPTRRTLAALALAATLAILAARWWLRSESDPDPDDVSGCTCDECAAWNDTTAYDPRLWP